MEFAILAVRWSENKNSSGTLQNSSLENIAYERIILVASSSKLDFRNERASSNSRAQGRRFHYRRPTFKFLHLTIIKLFVRHPSRNARVSVKSQQPTPLSYAIDDNFSGAPFVSLPTYQLRKSLRVRNAFQSWDYLSVLRDSRGKGYATRLPAGPRGARNGEMTARGTGGTSCPGTGTDTRRRGGQKNAAWADRAVNQPRARLPISSLIISDNFSGPSEPARPASSLFLRFFSPSPSRPCPRAPSSRPRKSS